MLLAVAGLKEDEIKKRTKNLAEGDWSAFAPAEQLAFRFAHRIAREPAEISDGEIRALSEAFGRSRAIDIIWYGGWCNYMTRVADAFQLPLERDNVFAREENSKSKEGKDSKKP
jgi:hypothetical protein